MKGNKSYKGSAAHPESVPNANAFARKSGRIAATRKASPTSTSISGPKLGPKKEY